MPCFSPPLSSAGVQRSLKLAHSLPDFDWTPYILTSAEDSFAAQLIQAGLGIFYNNLFGINNAVHSIFRHCKQGDLNKTNNNQVTKRDKGCYLTSRLVDVLLQGFQ
jgi:hypothetical protein